MTHFLYSFNKLETYCRNQEYKGWDPYDGLNSHIFQMNPFKKSAISRLIFIQVMKRSPFNLRHLLFVTKGFNPKGIGLFLSGYCNLYKILKERPDWLGPALNTEICFETIVNLANKLLEMQSDGYSGACWGYNFDWQSRIFFQPKGTPTVVVTSFVADSLFYAYTVTGVRRYLDSALSSGDFVIKDLNRTYKEQGFLLSYSPLDNSCVYNASLLGARLLARCYRYTKDEHFKDISKDIVKACLDRQVDDGSWIYGEAPSQNWIDSFHTGFNLECLHDYMKDTGDETTREAFNKGLEYYLKNFFLKDGIPKYYHNRTYPIDIHCPAQLSITISKTGKLIEYKDLVEKVLLWTVRNMQDKKGYFYYQLKPGLSSKIPYMRWSQAWMFKAFSDYFKATFISGDNDENMD